ncbi:hypothetical protein ABPG74_005141 [Tetrahymena malaccensis]
MRYSNVRRRKKIVVEVKFMSYQNISQLSNKGIFEKLMAIFCIFESEKLMVKKLNKKCVNDNQNQFYSSNQEALVLTKLQGLQMQSFQYALTLKSNQDSQKSYTTRGQLNNNQIYLFVFSYNLSQVRALCLRTSNNGTIGNLSTMIVETSISLSVFEVGQEQVIEED